MNKLFLTVSGVSSVFIALLHAVIIFVGAPAYRYFGAGEEMATMAESGSVLPALVTIGIVVVFLIFGLYAFSAAGYIRKLPYLHLAIPGIAALYTLRGFAVIPELLEIIPYPPGVKIRMICFSLFSLFTGIMHLYPIIKRR